MPITVKLSERFYQKLGHELVDEMVNWFNAVDATYRGDLREINELNFSRFDAKLEQRVAQLDAKLEQGLAAVRADVAGLAAKVEQRIAEVKADLRQEIGALRSEMSTLRTELAGQRAELINWIVGCGIAAVTVLGGLMFTLLRYFHP